MIGLHGQDEEQDFVWGEMLSYWESTGQLAPGEASAWGDMNDDETWRGLGYQVSYGSPYDGEDPQLGPEAPWHIGAPSTVSDGIASYWAESTGPDESEAGRGAIWDGPAFGWGAT